MQDSGDQCMAEPERTDSPAAAADASDAAELLDATAVARLWAARRGASASHDRHCAAMVQTLHRELLTCTSDDISRAAANAGTPAELAELAMHLRELRLARSNEAARDTAASRSSAPAVAGADAPLPPHRADAAADDAAPDAPLPHPADPSTTDERCPHQADRRRCRLCRREFHVAVVAPGDRHWHVDRACPSLTAPEPDDACHHGPAAIVGFANRAVRERLPCPDCAQVAEAEIGDEPVGVGRRPGSRADHRPRHARAGVRPRLGTG